MLTIQENEILFIEELIEKIGTVRYSKSFRLSTKDIAVIGYAPRFIIDDESVFLIIVDFNEQIYYFNLGRVKFEEYQKLERILGFSLRNSGRHFTDEEMHQGATEILYPEALRGKGLFEKWSYFSLKGLIKHMGYKMGMDNPMWERLTEEVVKYIRNENSKRTA